MNQLTLNEKIYTTAQAIKNICNQADLPLEVIVLIINNIHYEILNLINNKDAIETISSLRAELELYKNRKEEADI